MANKMYGKGAEKTLNKQIDWDSDDLRVVAIDNTYTPDLDTHEFLSDINAHQNGTPVALTGKSITGGYFDADDFSYALAAGVVKGFALYKFVTNAADSPLLAFIDTIVGFPLTTSGGTIPITWSNGTSKILSLRT